MKQLLIKLLLILSPITLLSLDQSSDVSVQFDPSDFSSRSYVKVNTMLYEDVWNGNGTIIFNPKFFCRANSSHAFSMSIGYRHKIKDHAFGNHVFINAKMHESALGPTILSQMGFSIDWIHKWVEARINYYVPNKVRDKYYGAHFNIPHFIESELVLKSPWFHIGWGPNYSCDSGNVGYISKLIIPFERFYCGVSVGKAWTETLHLVTSFGYNFGDYHSQKPQHAKINYCPGVSYSRTFTDNVGKFEYEIHKKKDDSSKKGVSSSDNIILEDNGLILSEVSDDM